MCECVSVCVCVLVRSFVCLQAKPAEAAAAVEPGPAPKKQRANAVLAGQSSIRGFFKADDKEAERDRERETESSDGDVAMASGKEEKKVPPNRREDPEKPDPGGRVKAGVAAVGPRSKAKDSSSHKARDKDMDTSERD